MGTMEIITADHDLKKGPKLFFHNIDFFLQSILKMHHIGGQCAVSYDKSVSCSDPDYEEEKLKILAGDRLPLPELADLMPWGTEVYEEV